LDAPNRRLVAHPDEKAPVAPQIDFPDMRSLAAMLVAGLLMAACASPSPTSQATPSPTAAESPTPALPSPTTTPSLATPSGPTANNKSFKLTRIATGLQDPLDVEAAGDGSGRIFIVEQVGRIRVVKDGVVLPTPFLDIRSLVTTGGSEQGLLSVAFHPQFKTNGVFIVDYTRSSKTPADVGDTVIARYRATPSADVAVRSSEETLLVINQPQSNHNGGLVKFGPDGLLYIGMGDGGAGGDAGAGHAPEGNGQSLTTLLGKLLRIEVGPTGPYTVPAGNPNLGAGALREIWADGLRNPWRFSFDRATGDLYIGDVGQNAYEEIDYQPAGATGGANYGWPVWEGNHSYRLGPTRTPDTKPVAEYSHAAGQCSVTGGYVYRGTKIPALSGFYVFGDYCAGRLWTLVRFGGAWRLSVLRETSLSIASFGEDEAGELYIVDRGGSVYRFDQA
jgi:glucose/arabinose dehydrogenase